MEMAVVKRQFGAVNIGCISERYPCEREEMHDVTHEDPSREMTAPRTGSERSLTDDGHR